MRNSSTLLFSTLITRIFGVKKGKDELSKKKKLSFFYCKLPFLQNFCYMLSNIWLNLKKKKKKMATWLETVDRIYIYICLYILYEINDCNSVTLNKERCNKREFFFLDHNRQVKQVVQKLLGPSTVIAHWMAYYQNLPQTWGWGFLALWDEWAPNDFQTTVEFVTKRGALTTNL